MPDDTAEPILERIAVSLAEAIARVKTAAGYRVDVRRVIRPDKTGIPNGLENIDVLFGQISDEARPGVQSSFTQGRIATFRLFVNIIQAEIDGTASDTYVNRVLADIHKAIHVDRQRNGLAVDTMWGDVVFTLNTDTLDGVCIDIPVIYETVDSDPYSL